MGIRFFTHHEKGLGLTYMEIEKADKFVSQEYTVAKNVAEHLEKKYPGWAWAVHVMDGVVVVNKIDNDYKAVTLAGGEILERYRQKTNGFNQDRYMDLKMDDITNQLDGDLSPGTS